MAEREACAEAVTAALQPTEPAERPAESERAEAEVTPASESGAAPETVAAAAPAPAPAPARPSPFAKFRQLERQSSAGAPRAGGGGGGGGPQSPGSPAPLFKFTDPALQASAATIKDRLLQWCRDKTRDYENVKPVNFSTSWADGLAFCALLHHFLPDAFDYAALTPERRRHNFTLAFKIADEKAGIYPLLDVDDMVAMRKPDWKCVFTYVQAIHRRFRDLP